jgi:CheY-like chemotaxis protein
MIHSAYDDREMGARVLIVEDDTDTATSTATLLSLFGYRVQIANDGPQALTAAPRWRPEVVLLDIGLPVMDGYQVAIRLRQEEACRGAVIIAVTGHGRPEDRQRCRAAGIHHHLLKPVDLRVLLSLLARSVATSVAHA